MMSQGSDSKFSIYPIKKCPEVLAIRYLVAQYADFSIAPEEFQRPTAWSQVDKKKYFSSILMDRLEGSFVFVDLIPAIKKLESIAPKNRACTYFKEFRQQKKQYLTLDANNRLKMTSALLKDEWKIPHGDYEYVFGDEVCKFEVTFRNDRFSKLDENVRNEIEGRCVTVSVYSQIDYKGLSEVFLNVNSGVPLNPQEKRNAFGTDWADYVRELRNSSMPFLELIHKNPMNRLYSDNWIADALCFASGITEDEVYGITQITKDVMYRSKFSRTDYTDTDGIEYKGTDYYSAKYAQLGQFITRMNDSEIPYATRPSTCMNLFWMVCNGITTYEQAVSAVMKHEKLYNRSSTNENGRTFKWACGCLGIENNTIRMIELPAIVEQVLNPVIS